jgi:hypothetical protein
MPSDPETPFIKIAVLENAFEAQFLSSMLVQYDIPHRLRSYHDTAYDGLYQFRMAGARFTARSISVTDPGRHRRFKIAADQRSRL